MKIMSVLMTCTTAFVLAMNSVSAEDCGQALVKSTGYRGAYFKNGEIHVNTYGKPEGKPLTTGHWDFKPSWSKTGDMLVFFRRLKNDPDVSKWKTAIHVINANPDERKLLEGLLDQWQSEMTPPAWPSKPQRRKVSVDGQTYEINI